MKTSMPPSSRSASRSFAGNVSARRLERAKLREAAQRIPSPRRGSSILASAFFDDALWSTILGFLSPADVAVFGRVCKATCACASSEWANWWLKAQSQYVLPSLLLEVLAPPKGIGWTWERLQICAERCLVHEDEAVIEFWVASDQINTSTCRSAAQVAKLDAIAAILRRHPRLKIRVDGHAATDAPKIYGGPISQARATRVRSELLRRLRDHPAWIDEAPLLGRAPAHMDDRDIEDTYQMYVQEVVGTKLQASGVWRKDTSYFALLPSCGGQSAEVRIVGFED